MIKIMDRTLRKSVVLEIAFAASPGSKLYVKQQTKFSYKYLMAFTKLLS